MMYGCLICAKFSPYKYTIKGKIVCCDCFYKAHGVDKPRFNNEEIVKNFRKEHY